MESSAEDNNVEAYVSFLRKKMKFLGSTARIETLRRAGYRFVADAEAADAEAADAQAVDPAEAPEAGASC